MEDSNSNYSKEFDSNNEPKKSEKDSSSNLSNSNKSDSSNSEFRNHIINKLIEIGFRSGVSKRLVYIFRPPNVEQAIEYLSEENGIIQHCFIEHIISNNKCYICQKGKEEHILRRNNDFQFIKNINFNKIKNISNSSSINDSSSSRSIQIKNYPQKVEKKYGKQICFICDEEYMQSNYTTLEKCSHSFCKACWRKYLSVEIKEKKLIKIKCIESSCNVILPEIFIYFLIKKNNELISRFNENKLRQEILDNPMKKFCPFQNCNSYARRNSKKQNIVKCENGHSFCFYCLQKPHKGKKCGKELDEKMEEFAKKKFIKKCPKCHIWSEKISGCNHMTCAECGYQWCWLCNQQYEPKHYEIGKCKGFQFFKPKNEKDIQLAFEGKIKIRSDERMSDISSYFFDSDTDSSISFNHFYFPPYNNLNRTPTPPVIVSGFMQKLEIFILFLFFGFIFSIICESGRYISDNNLFMRRYAYNFHCVTYFIAIIFLGFSFFFLQIVINIILFILIIINNSLSEFFNSFYSNLRKIRNLYVMEKYEVVISRNIYNFTAPIISLFFGCFFWIFKYMDNHDFYIFIEDRNSKIIILYSLTLILIISFIYPFSILINIVGIIEEIHRRGFYKLKDHIKDYFKDAFGIYN